MASAVTFEEYMRTNYPRFEKFSADAVNNYRRIWIDAHDNAALIIHGGHMSREQAADAIREFARLGNKEGRSNG